MRLVGKGGYSLIEVLVSLTLFSLAALGLSAAVGTVIRAGKLSANLTLATILAQDKLEELLAQGPPLSDGNDTPEPQLSRTWTATLDTPAVGVTQIEVVVSWTDSAVHAVTLTTVLNE